MSALKSDLDDPNVLIELTTVLSRLPGSALDEAVAVEFGRFQEIAQKTDNTARALRKLAVEMSDFSGRGKGAAFRALTEPKETAR